MRPLSAYKHYISNKKRFLFIFVPVLLSTILIYTLQMLITSEFRTINRLYTEPQKYYISIAAKTKTINNEIINSVFDRKKDYERVFPWVAHYTYIDSLMESSVGSKVFTVRQEDMKWLIARMNLKIIKGRLPKAGSNEIILHKTVADNKELTIGDKIGGNLRKDEAIEGEKVIVGLIDGVSIVSFDSLEYWMDINHVQFDDYSTGIIIIPKENRVNSINSFIKTIDPQGLDIRTYDTVSLQSSNDSSRIKIIVTAISIMALIMITICAGFISYINISQRRSEFGILSAIGFTSHEIMKRVAVEILWVNMAALVIGIFISVFLGTFFNLFVFKPQGISLLLLRPEYMIKASCVPVFCCIFSLAPVWNTLTKLDTVAVIEGTV